MDGVPEKPGEIAVDLNSGNTDDGIARAERDEHPFGNVTIGFERLAALAMCDVVRDELSVSDGDGRDLRSIFMQTRVRRDSGISGNKNFREILKLQMFIYRSASRTVVRTGKRFGRFVCSNARRPDNRRRGNFVGAIDFYAAAENLSNAGIVANLNSFAAQTTHGVGAQFGMNGGENFVRGFDEQQTERIACEAAIAARGVVEKKILEISEQFHAGIASADNGDGEQAAALGGIGNMVGVFAEIENVLAEDDGVFERLKVERIFARAAMTNES